MNTIRLQNGFRLHHDDAIGRYELENVHANIFYRLEDPRGFVSLDGWITHVERAANAAPGSFHSIKGVYDGKHWQASSPVHSGSATSAGPSARGAAASLAGASPTAIYSAFRAGHISASDAADALRYALAAQSPPYYGGLGSSQAAAAQAAAAQAAYNAQYQLALMALASAGPLTSGPPHQPTTLKPDGFHAGEIIAWRAWNIKDDELVSVVAESKPWSATEPMKGDAAAGYGVHAYKAPHGPLLDSYVEKGSSKLWVIGEIALWGDIIEHEDGYRAEYGRVHSLVTWHEKVPQLQRKMIAFKYLQSQPAYKIDDAA